MGHDMSSVSFSCASQVNGFRCALIMYYAIAAPMILKLNLDCLGLAWTWTGHDRRKMLENLSFSNYFNKKSWKTFNFPRISKNFQQFPTFIMFFQLSNFLEVLGPGPSRSWALLGHSSWKTLKNNMFSNWSGRGRPRSGLHLAQDPPKSWKV